MNDSEVDQFLAQAEQSLQQALGGPKPPQAQQGPTPEQIVGLVEQTVSQRLQQMLPALAALPGKDGQDGQSVTLEDVKPLVEEAVAQIPAPKDGKDGKDGKPGRIVERVIKMPDYTRLLEPDGAAQVAFTQSGSGAIAGSAQTELRYFVRPEQFGAVGDDSTNDRTAFVNALSRLSSGGELWLQSGKTYKIEGGALPVSTNGITIRSIGGPLLAVIKIYGDNPGIDLSAAYFTFKGCLLIHATGTGSATSYGIAATGVQVPFLNMESVYVQGFPGDGARFNNVFLSRFSNCIFQDNGGFGLNVLTGTSLAVSSCFTNGNATGGYKLAGVQYSSLTANGADNNTGPAYWLDECTAVFMGGNGSENNIADGSNRGALHIVGARNVIVAGHLTSADNAPGANTVVVSVSDSGGVVTSNLDISGVRIASQAATYAYDVNCGSAGTVFIRNSDAMDDFNRTNGLAGVKAKDYAFFNESGTLQAAFTGGYLRFGASAGGIQFNGDTDAANALDDYEEGSWTPVVADAGSGGNVASGGSFSGHYTKIGRQVILNGVCNGVATAGMTGTNAIFIRGLPFAINNNINVQGSVMVDALNFVTAGAYVIAWGGGSTSYAQLRECSDNAASATVLVNAIASGSTNIQFTLTYFV